MSSEYNVDQSPITQSSDIRIRCSLAVAQNQLFRVHRRFVRYCRSDHLGSGRMPGKCAMDEKSEF